ncbi:MAG: FGGY-family carbohydrate kinase [Pseudomonadota bacterium]|nr:FGGY-family carbohydrate kinase [Pseudomonadota bacterium]MDO7710517.1 FGGY-family carbohydrate kinase [Pseudomonadota bacterium]
MRVMNNNAYIGIDLGTSGCRAIAIDDNSNIIASSRLAFQASHSDSYTSEQDPSYHWQCVKHVLTDLISLILPISSQSQCYEIKSIAVDATSGSILITDQLGNPQTPLLMYNDARAIEQAKLIADIAPAQSGAHGASSGLAKLVYLQQHNDLAKSPNNHLLHQADWINFNLGAPLGISDENNALKTGYDPVERCWPNWLDLMTNRAVLPKVVPPGTIIGLLSDDLCRQLNLTSSPQIVAGTTDSIAALLATGAHKLGDAVTSLGSTLVVKLISDTPIFLPEQGIYSHRLDDKWLVGGASNTGGAVLNMFFNNDELQSLSSLISLNNQVADYYPLLTKGERFPINDSELAPRLSPRPNSDVEFLHGMLTAMAKIEQQAYQKLQEAGASPVKSIRTVGGGAVNQVWQAIRQQHILVPFISAEHTEAAFGAACLAKNATAN